LPRLGESRLAMLELLAERFDSLPVPGGGTTASGGSNPFEAIVRVALGLAADHRTASAAFDALRDAGLIEPGPLAEIDPLELEDVLKQARVRLPAKAVRPLQRIAGWASERDFDAESVARLSTESIREAWRSLRGVGPSTADSLLLFALGRATYPVDRASYRILVRHGWLDPSSDHDEARSVLEAIAPDDAPGLAQLSLSFEKLGRDSCGPGQPRCDGCPLQSLLPEGGPVDANG
jgi:endonuclease III related protein